MGANWSESRVRLRKFLSSCIITSVSVRRKDSQGCTADVKDTPPSPKEKPDFSSSEKKHVVADDEGFFESPDDLMVKRRTLSEPAKSDFHIPLRQQSHLMMTTGSLESNDSGVSFGINRYNSLPRLVDFSFSEKKHVVSDDKGLVESPDNQMAKRCMKSSDSGVSLKSDWSKAEPIDFKDRVFLRLDFSSSEEEDVSDDEDLVESPDDLREDDILPYMYPWADDCDWMELADNLELDFSSS